MPSNLAVTLPFESTTNVYGSVGRPQMLVASTGIGQVVLGQHRLELPVGKRQLVWLDVDERQPVLVVGRD